jgi:hypothetical protein
MRMAPRRGAAAVRRTALRGRGTARHSGRLCRRNGEKDTPPSATTSAGCGRENGEEMTMDACLNYLGSPLTLKVVKHLNSAGAAVHDSALPAATQELVRLRASQING